MKTIAVGEFKTILVQIIQRIQKEEEYIVSYGRKKKKIFKVTPFQDKNLSKGN